MEPSPAQPITPVPSKTAHANIFIIFAVIVFFTIIAAALGYYFGTRQKETPPAPPPTIPQATPLPTVAPSSPPAQTSWKTYTDSKNGFSFEYPSNWQVVTLPDPSAGIALQSPANEPVTSGSVTFSGEIYVRAMNNPNDLPIRKVFDNFNDTSRFWFAQFPNEEVSTPLSGVTFPAIKEKGIDYTITNYIFSAEKKLIFFTYSYKTPKVMDTFRKIVQSLKIVKPAGVTYKNNKYGFTLSFPEIWRGYEVTTHINGNMETMCFTLIGSPGSQPFCLLNIYVFTKDAWNALGKKPYLITQNEQSVFASDVQDGQCVQLDEFQCARSKEGPSIINTFTFTTP